MLKKIGDKCFQFRAEYERNASFSQKFLLMSDIHFDNPKCDRKALKEHLDFAVEIGAKVMIFGDLFCAMQGKFDKRGSKSSIRPENQTDNYLDSLVDTAAVFFEPYRDAIMFISPGNHETSIKSRHETDLTARLADAIGCQHGPYQGYIKFSFSAKTGGGVRQKTLMYHHGYGGGGPVTKDIIQANRKAVWAPDADIMVSGHTHDGWIFAIPRERVLSNGDVIVENQLHLKTGTYKNETSTGNGWAVEKGMPAKYIGCILLNFVYKNHQIKVETKLIEK